MTARPSFAFHKYLVPSVCCALLALTAERGLAEGFRIETKIFVDDEDEPASTAMTLFLDGVVYDFLGEPEQIAGVLATHGFFETVGVQPVLGRGFTAEEDVPNAPRVVVISSNLRASSPSRRRASCR